ncbi:MAG: hypothetical protein U0T80_04890 [Flavobacteriaceae bacterium]
MFKDKSTTIAIIGLVLTSVGIIFPILYENLKNNSELQIKLEDSITIINKPVEVDSLEIFYKKQPISNLNKATLTITNKSNNPIVQEDFIAPLEISLSKKSHIITFNVEKSEPKNLESNIVINQQKGNLTLSFALLNPQDKLTIGILYTGANPKIDVNARIKGIKNINFIDKQNSNEKIKIPSVVLFFTILSSLFLFLVHREKRLSIIQLEKYQEESKGLIEKYSLDQITKDVNTFFYYIPTRSRDFIIYKITNVFKNEESEDLVREYKEIITGEFNNLIKLNSRAEVVGHIIRIIGLIYLIFWFFTIG